MVQSSAFNPSAHPELMSGPCIPDQYWMYDNDFEKTIIWDIDNHNDLEETISWQLYIMGDKIMSSFECFNENNLIF